MTKRLGSTIALAAACVLTGSCSSVRSTYVPDGRRGFTVECGGLLSSWSTCLVKAGRACGNHGYDTLIGNEDDRRMLVACKIPPIPTIPPK